MNPNLPPGCSLRDCEGPQDVEAELEREIERADQEIDIERND